MKNKQDRNNSLAILNGFIFYHIIAVCVCVGVRLCGRAFVWMCVCVGVHEHHSTGLAVKGQPSRVGSSFHHGFPD